MNCRSNYTGEDSLIKKIGSPLPGHICIKHFEEKYYKKRKNSTRYCLAINMKPVATIFDLKKVIRNKQCYLTNLYSSENTEETFISRRLI